MYVPIDFHPIFGHVSKGGYRRGWLGSTSAGSLCWLSLRESTPFRGAKGDFTQRENYETNLNGDCAAPNCMKMKYAFLHEFPK